MIQMTVPLGRQAGLIVVQHSTNRGHGGNLAGYQNIQHPYILEDSMEQTQGALPLSRVNRLFQVFYRSILIWEKPFSAAVLTGIILFSLTLVFGTPWGLSKIHYYNYLADAFLHGQLSLRLLPVNTLDLSLYQGQYYLYWGPLPAILIMPFVALFGIGFSDILQSIIVGSINIGLFALLLLRANQRGLIELNSLQRALLVLFFALGTAHTPLLALGTVWHLAQLVAICFALLAYLAVVSFENQKAFFLAGCAMACVLATRNSVVLVAIFPIWYLLQRHWHVGYTRLFKFCLLGVTPGLGVMLLLLCYNAARFGSPFDYGLSYHLMGPTFYEMHAKYGVLNIHYIPTNLYYNFLYYPFATLRQNYVVPAGGSLFLLSPLYFASITALWQNRKEKSTWFLFLTVLAGSIPALMIMAPGSFNFGPRYLLDVAPPLLLLTALGMKRWPIPLVSICIVISVLHYLIGTLMMVHAWN